jgi:glycosyltransferase involved in cell wall biosynthesis
MRKKRILFHSNSPLAFTGFGKNKKNILRYFFREDKYEIIDASNGHVYEDDRLKNLPWKAVGTIPRDMLTNQYASSQDKMRQNAYGYFGIDDLIKEFRPDIYVGIEDIWGLNLWDKKWWSILNPMIWTTLDSLPILDTAYEGAKKTENFFVWASFAEKAMKEKGFNNVKTLHGSIDSKLFYKMPDNHRSTLRKKFNIAEDDFVIGFVFRNQLRKSVPNLLDGFNIFRKNNPKAKLLLHTHWGEGWDINKLLNEKGIPRELILTTYYCSECSSYLVKPFTGEKQQCPFCKSKDTLNTTNVRHGVSEQQLNEIYNLMDVYCHPFTSGGQEIPIQEAKLCELITLVTNYSCGEDHCTEESGGLALEWSEYREPGTQFIKASTSPQSIAQRLSEVYNMSIDERSSIGQIARRFVLDNYSVESVCQKLEAIFDSMPYVEDEKWQEFDTSNPLDVSRFVDDNGNKKLLIAVKDGWTDTILANSLVSNLKRNYREYDIYFACNPKLFSVVDCHSDIYKVIPFNPAMENIIAMEGNADNKKIFDIVYLPYLNVRKIPHYTHNLEDKIAYNL